METSYSVPGLAGVGGLQLEQLDASPITQLERWLHDAIEHSVPHPSVMVLATMAADGQLDQRALLLRHCDARGLVFFSDDSSKKISDLNAHPLVSAYFPWFVLDRQVRLSGRVERISAAEATRYLVMRPECRPAEPQPWDHDTGASASSRAYLMQQFSTMQRRFYGGGGRPVGHWSGYRIVPERFEFWQGGGPRLRDRFAYVSTGNGAWKIESIAS